MSRDDSARSAQVAEGNLLGGLILMPHLHAETRMRLLDGELFYFDAHRIVYRKIGELGKAANLRSVGVAIGSKALESIGGIAKLSAYEDGAYAATADWVMWFADRVGDLGRRRKLAAAAGGFQQQVTAGEDLGSSWDELCGVYDSLVPQSSDDERRATG